MSLGMLEIIIASGKGGVGKSIITSSLALIFAEKNIDFVAVDADAEAPNLNIALGITDWDTVEPYYEGKYAEIIQEKCVSCGECLKACPFSAVELNNNKYTINKWICEGCYTCSFVCPTKAIRIIRNIIAGYIKIKNKTPYGFPLVSGEIVPGRPNSGKLVTEVKNRAKKIGGKDSILLVDGAAGIGCQVISSLAGAHIAILVAEPTPASLSDLKRIHKLTKHFMIPSALIINKYDMDLEYYEIIKSYALKENIEIIGEVPFDDHVVKSVANITPLLIKYPDAPASKAIRKIGLRIINILQNYREWRLKHLPEKIEPFIPIVIKP